MIASNRLPVRLATERGTLDVRPSAGGLASALRAVRGDSVWIGWPGSVVRDSLQAEATERLAEDNLVPIFLSAGEIDDFYNRVCNDTLWPLLHYFGDRLRLTPEAWERYVRVNERFADAILEHSGPGSRVWIHDFHLMLVPAMLRRRAPDLVVGFFLHTPFPSSEVYRLLPAREQVLRGLLGADYVSFQVGDYARHFRSSCLRILGLDSTPDSIEVDGRPVGIGVDPIGIDTAGFIETLKEPETARLLADLELQYQGRKLVLGVERLDYTKGIPHKLLAFERLLEREPERARTTTMLQVLVPSRLESPEYRQQRDEIELLIARINGRFGQPGQTPVEYLHRDISKAGLVALYRRADVMMVTPLRDGMNLVAHEFVLCQSEPGLPSRWRGSLLLSELAGSAQVLPGAALVNPWNVDDVVDRLGAALELSLPERRRRLETMARRVDALDCRKWADGFLTRLGRHSRRDRQRRTPPDVEGEVKERLLRRFVRARSRTILLDYDGTIREIEPHPDLAIPTREIRALLRELAALPRTDVHIVSGRRRRNLEQWLGPAPDPPVRRARLSRARAGRRVADAPRPRPRLDAPDRAAPAPGRRRRSRRARRAEGVQRRLALPRGRAGVRVVARPRAPQRPRAAPRGSACRDPPGPSRDRGAGAGRRQGRVRAEHLPGGQGVDAVRLRARRRPHRPRSPRRASAGIDRGSRRRPASEHAFERRAARPRPHHRAGRGAGAPA